MIIKGKHAVIVGGGRRLGQAITQSLLDLGANVSFTYHSSEKEAKDFAAKNPSCKPFKLDLSDIESFSSVAESISKGFQAPDILILCASDFFSTPLGKVSSLDWDKLHVTNIKGHFFFTQSLLPYFKKGVLITMCDIHAHVPLKNFSAYVPQKAAFKMLSRNLALELSPHIRVNSISPGSVLFPDSFTNEQKQNHLEHCLLKKEGTPKDITEAVRFLIENDYMTGFDLKVDGGRSLTNS